MNVYYDYIILYVNDGTKKTISHLETTIQCKTTEQKKNIPLKKNLATERMQKIKRKYIDDNVSEKISQIFDKNLCSKLTIL
jgi:UDP-N-acetylglucosamine 2-epimerase